LPQAFDILHFGHVSYLNQARDKCDRLVIGLNHDKSVKILKGETVRAYGGEVCVMDVFEGHSTTGSIEKMSA